MVTSVTPRRSSGCTSRSADEARGAIARSEPEARDEGERYMLGVVATLKVKPGMEREFEAVAKELVAKVNADEPGCRLYALHRLDGDKPTYVFMERYVDQAAVEAHRATEFFKALRRNKGVFMEGRVEGM